MMLGLMRVKRAIAGCLLAAATWSTPAAAQVPAAPGPVIVFEGARLIAGDGGVPLERSAFVVDRGRFTPRRPQG